MFYTDRDGSRRHPINIHRTSIGCYERTLALLIEKYAGALPLWMAPEQVRVLPISERHLEAAGQLADQLRQAGLRVTVDDRDEKIGKKIREGQMDKLQYMLIMGDQEVDQGTISVRSRLDGDLGVMPVDSLIERLRTEVAQKRNKV